MNASQRSFAKGALYAYLNPRLATDIAFDRIPIWPADRMQIAVRKAVRGRLANDADIEDLPDFIASLQQMLEEMDNGNGEEDPNSSGNDNDQELPSMSPDDLAATIKANMSAYNADEKATFIALANALLNGGGGGKVAVDQPEMMPSSMTSGFDRKRNAKDSRKPAMPAMDAKAFNSRYGDMLRHTNAGTGVLRPAS